MPESTDILKIDIKTQYKDNIFNRFFSPYKNIFLKHKIINGWGGIRLWFILKYKISVYKVDQMNWMNDHVGNNTALEL